MRVTDYMISCYLHRQGNTSQLIWLDDLDCDFGDSCLTTCQRCPGSEDYNCGHNEDVTITCCKVDVLIQLN